MPRKSRPSLATVVDPQPEAVAVPEIQLEPVSVDLPAPPPLPAVEAPRHGPIRIRKEHVKSLLVAIESGDSPSIGAAVDLVLDLPPVLEPFDALLGQALAELLPDLLRISAAKHNTR